MRYLVQAKQGFSGDWWTFQSVNSLSLAKKLAKLEQSETVKTRIVIDDLGEAYGNYIGGVAKAL